MFKRETFFEIFASTKLEIKFTTMFRSEKPCRAHSQSSLLSLEQHTQKVEEF